MEVHPDTISTSGNQNIKKDWITDFYKYQLKITEIIFWTYTSFSLKDLSAYELIKYEGRFKRNMFSAICNCWEVHNAFIYNASFSDQPNIEFEVHPEIGHIYSEIQSVQTAMALGRLPLSFRHCVEKFTLMIGKRWIRSMQWIRCLEIILIQML